MKKLALGKTYSEFKYMILKYEFMSKRITIMIDDDLDKKLRQRQAKMIQQINESYSYSKTINDVLRKSI